LSKFRSNFRPAALGALALAVAAGCGSSGATTSTTVPSVSSCLQKAGYGVTVVPASQIAAGGPENRGPGQTGELLVGRQGVKPSIGADTADAVVAFWRSASLAKNSPNAKANGLGTHADAIGSITVQATTHLVLYAVKAAKTTSGRQAAFRAQVGKIEACVG
jgi:hypothetical protein